MSSCKAINYRRGKEQRLPKFPLELITVVSKKILTGMINRALEKRLGVIPT